MLQVALTRGDALTRVVPGPYLTRFYLLLGAEPKSNLEGLIPVLDNPVIRQRFLSRLPSTVDLKKYYHGGRDPCGVTDASPSLTMTVPWLEP